MDIEKLIEDLRGLLKQYGEKIPYGELVGAPWPYSRSGDLVWQDPEPYFIEQAATALSTLQIENQALRNSANGFKAENEKLRAELEQVKRCVEIVEHQRDEAIYDMTALMAGQCCDLCAVEYCNDRGKTEMCTAFKWRGLLKED